MQKEDRMKVLKSIKQVLYTPPTLAHKSNKDNLVKKGGKGRGLYRHMGRKVTRHRWQSSITYPKEKLKIHRDELRILLPVLEQVSKPPATLKGPWSWKFILQQMLNNCTEYSMSPLAEVTISSFLDIFILFKTIQSSPSRAVSLNQ